MNQQIEDDIEVVASSQSDQRGKRKFESNIPGFSDKPSVRLEGSSAPDRGRKWRYTSKDIKRIEKLVDNGIVKPLLFDPETFLPAVATHFALEKGAKVLGEKLDAHNASVDAAKSAGIAHTPEAGHIAPHITGPEPAILPHLPPVKPPIPLRPIGK